MNKDKFLRICNNIKEQIKPFHFDIVERIYHPGNFGNFIILCTDGVISFRITQDHDQCFFHVQSNSKTWELITEYIDKNYKDSTLGFDMKLHKLYQTDFSIETNLKFINKFLALTCYNNL